jgi:hypothetical protein
MPRLQLKTGLRCLAATTAMTAVCSSAVLAQTLANEPPSAWHVEAQWLRQVYRSAEHQNGQVFNEDRGGLEGPFLRLRRNIASKPLTGHGRGQGQWYLFSEIEQTAGLQGYQGLTHLGLPIATQSRVNQQLFGIGLGYELVDQNQKWTFLSQLGQQIWDRDILPLPITLGLHETSRQTWMQCGVAWRYTSRPGHPHDNRRTLCARTQRIDAGGLFRKYRSTQA